MAPAGMLEEDGDVGVEPSAGAAPDVGGTDVPGDGVGAELDMSWAPRAAIVDGDAMGAPRAAASGAAAVEPPAGAAWSRRV
jgi:hypothetical protein